MAWQKNPKNGTCDICDGDRIIEKIEPVGGNPLLEPLYHSRDCCEPCGVFYMESLQKDEIEAVKVFTSTINLKKNIA